MKTFVTTILLSIVILMAGVGLTGFKSTPDRVIKSYLHELRQGIDWLKGFAEDLMDQDSQKGQRSDTPAAAGPPVEQPVTKYNSLPSTPKNWTEAKRVVYGMYSEETDPKTLYCNCDFRSSDRRVDPRVCGYQDITNSQLSKRTEIEHIVPASWIGGRLACWQAGGRAICDQQNQWYQVATADLHNLAPAIGRVNRARVAKPFRLLPGEARNFGYCDLEVSEYGVEPAPGSRGRIARATLYMHRVYSIAMNPDYLRLMQTWDKEHPADHAECVRNKKIQRIQGMSNPYIDRSCYAANQAAANQ